MKIQYAARTDVGRRRNHNEDAYLVDDQLNLFVVADGMGGHAAGEVASRVAVDALHDTLVTQTGVIDEFVRQPDPENAETVRRALERSVRAAAYQVFGVTEQDPDRKGMGTTLSALLLLPQAAVIAHVGDSRIYMIRERQYKLVTSDHTYVAAMVESGQMSEQEALQSGYSNVLLRAVGPTDYVDVDTRVVTFATGDIFLLCSDGLHGYLEEGDLLTYVFAEDLEGSADRLVQLALDRGGKDNITGILVRVD